MSLTHDFSYIQFVLPLIHSDSLRIVSVILPSFVLQDQTFKENILDPLSAVVPNGLVCC